MVATPCYALAQPNGGRRLVGVLGAASPESGLPQSSAFRAGLQELGYLQGRDVDFVVRWAYGHMDRLPTLAAELVEIPEVRDRESDAGAGVADQAAQGRDRNSSRCATDWCANQSRQRGSGQQWHQVETAGPAPGVAIQFVEARRSDDLEGAFQTFTSERAEALLVLYDALFFQEPGG